MSRRWLLVIMHLLFWVSTAWFLTSGFSIVSQEIERINGNEKTVIIRSPVLVYQIAGVILSAVLLFYINMAIIYRLNKHHIRPATIIYTIGVTLAFAWLGIWLSGSLAKPLHPQLPTPMVLGIVFFYAAISVAVALFRLWYFNRQQQQDLLLQKKQNDLALLKRQLEPHFVFNALNNLLSMVPANEYPRLRDSLQRLAQLLRHVVDETPTGKVTIEEELSFIRDYIALQLLRFPDNEVAVDFSTTGEYKMQRVEPGLLICFVENAFKYGTEPEVPSLIKIVTDISQEHKIVFRVENKIMMRKIGEPGIGIAITKKRLLIAYPDRHELLINENDHYSVTLTLLTE